MPEACMPIDCFSKLSLLPFCLSLLSWASVNPTKTVLTRADGRWGSVKGIALGMDAGDLWFDPLFLVVKGMQDKQMDVLNAIRLFSEEGLNSTGGLSNNSNGAPKALRPIMDSALVAMCMMQGLTSAIVNPNDLRLMETIKSCDIFKNNELYSDSYLNI